VTWRGSTWVRKELGRRWIAYTTHSTPRFSYFNQVQAVIAAVPAQMAAMLKYVSDTPTVSANRRPKRAAIAPKVMRSTLPFAFPPSSSIR
jgi:hypothetical protein